MNMTTGRLSNTLKSASHDVHTGTFYQNLPVPNCPIPGVTTWASLSTAPLTPTPKRRVSKTYWDQARQIHQIFAKEIENSLCVHKISAGVQGVRTGMQPINVRDRRSMDNLKAQRSATMNKRTESVSRGTYKSLLHADRHQCFPEAGVMVSLTLSTEWVDTCARLIVESDLHKFQSTATHEALKTAANAFERSTLKAVPRHSR